MATGLLLQPTRAVLSPRLRSITAQLLVMVIFVGLAWLTSGCTRTVRAPETFPTPVTEKLSLRIGLYQDHLFRDHVYHDASATSRTWVIDLRPIHRTLFKTLLSALFSELIEIEAPPGTALKSPRLDGIIEPQVQALTLQSPSASGTSSYRIALIYLLKVYSPQGELLGSWAVEGQGQGQSSWLQAGRAVTEALTNALRDIGAQIATALPERPAIKDLLALRQAQNAKTAAPSRRSKSDE